MSNELKCPICGEPTRVYMGNARKDRLCGKHANMLKAGEIEYNDYWNKYFLIKPKLCNSCNEEHFGLDEICENCKNKKNNDSSNSFINFEKKIETNNNREVCVICGENSKGKPQCKNCYYETVDFIDSLDKNTSIRKTRDYYYNLKERILIINNIEEAKKQCNKLIAIALVADRYNDDSSLVDRVYKDVETLLQRKKAPNENKIIEEAIIEKDENKSKINTAEDGHNVDSDMEVRIDDILYHAYILHSYGKNIEEITEKRKKCDWFIPILNDQGIYIEYWGMKTQKYLEERKEKEELYKKYNIPYISIEADDPKKDTQTFKTNLLREITNLATQIYGFMPRWKK